jgi:hypothetical protein
MSFSDDSDEPLDRWDFQTAARWIVDGPRSILFTYDHMHGLWWDKEFQLRENRKGSTSLLTLTVYRPFVCQDGLTWSILRRCDFQKSAFQIIRQDRSAPAVHVSYRRIEQTHPQHDDEILALAETLLGEIREPATIPPDAQPPEFNSRQLSGWYYGSIQFVESLRLPATLRKWHSLVSSVEASAHDDVPPEELIERFETAPLNEPIDLPGPEVPWFYRHINDWRLLDDDDA